MLSESDSESESVGSSIPSRTTVLPARANPASQSIARQRLEVEPTGRSALESLLRNGSYTGTHPSGTTRVPVRMLDASAPSTTSTAVPHATAASIWSLETPSVDQVHCPPRPNAPHCPTNVQFYGPPRGKILPQSVGHPLPSPVGSVLSPSPTPAPAVHVAHDPTPTQTNHSSPLTRMLTDLASSPKRAGFEKQSDGNAVRASHPSIISSVHFLFYALIYVHF